MIRNILISTILFASRARAIYMQFLHGKTSLVSQRFSQILRLKLLSIIQRACDCGRLAACM